jgi:hypothetical protein
VLKITHKGGPAPLREVSTVISKDDLLGKLRVGRPFSVPVKSTTVILSRRLIVPTRVAMVVDTDSGDQVWPETP